MCRETAEILVINFDQDKYEEMLSQGHRSLTASRKQRSVYSSRVPTETLADKVSVETDDTFGEGLPSANVSVETEHYSGENLSSAKASLETISNSGEANAPAKVVDKSNSYSGEDIALAKKPRRTKFDRKYNSAKIVDKSNCHFGEDIGLAKQSHRTKVCSSQEQNFANKAHKAKFGRKCGSAKNKNQHSGENLILAKHSSAPNFGSKIDSAKSHSGRDRNLAKVPPQAHFGEE